VKGIFELRGLPPIQGFNASETEILDEIFNPVWHNCDGRGQAASAHLACNGAQRWAIQVIHVRVGQKNGVDPREIGDAKAGMALPTKHDQPRSEDGIDEESLAGGLDQERRMPNEGDGSVGRQDLRRLGCAAGERLGMTLAHQTPELT